MTTTPKPIIVVLGAINWDITLFVESLPIPGQEVIISEIARVPGGTGANVAVAAARLLEPGAVAFVGALGDDSVADQQRTILVSEGIVCDGVATISAAESGQAFIMVDAASQNVIASALGANALLRPDHIREPAVRAMIGTAQVCAISDPPPDVIEELLTITDETACRVSWDPGVLAATDRDTVLSLARRVDTLLLNEEEAASLFPRQDPPAIANQMNGEGWSNRIILKRGGQGAHVIDLRRGQLIEVPPLPLANLGMTPVSSVGAGDAFHGALSALEAQGYSADDALIYAACAAGIKVSRPGTRDTPTAAELSDAVDAWRVLGAFPRIAPL